MTLREDDVRPLFIDDFQTLADEAGTLFIYTQTRDGIEVYARRADRVYQLYTRDRSPRRFKSADTAIRFALNLPGVDRIMWDGLETPYSTRPSHHKRHSSNDTS